MNKRVVFYAMIALIVGGLAMGASLFLKKNPLRAIFGKYVWIPFVLIGVSALILAFRRDTYLPSLGETIVPCSVLPETTPENATEEVDIETTPGAKVLYWATEPATSSDIPSWKQAYGEYKNAGVTVADSEGNATLRFRKPQSYTVPTKTLQPHVHYRSCMGANMSRIETEFVEPFEPGQNDLEESEESDITPALESFLDSLAEATVTVPVDKRKSESFMDYSPADFTAQEPMRSPTNDNTLYGLAEETERKRLPLDEMGIDESPQPAGSDYDIAFRSTIPQ